MMYYKDFTECTYFNGGEWLCRLMAVGWIENGKPFPKGPTDKQVIERIQALSEQFYDAFPSISFRGLHDCSVCVAAHDHRGTLEKSHINLFIPHRGFVFVVPGRVDHYINAHQYLPPESFIEALIVCPNPHSAEYRDAIQASNRGVDAPIFSGIPRIVDHCDITCQR